PGVTNVIVGLVLVIIVAFGAVATIGSNANGTFGLVATKVSSGGGSGSFAGPSWNQKDRSVFGRQGTRKEIRRLSTPPAESITLQVAPNEVKGDKKPNPLDPIPREAIPHQE